MSENTVELVGHYGSDLTHALSAWTSTGRDLSDEKRARVGALLGMLAREGHHTPFEKSMLHFLIRVEQPSHIHVLKHRIAVAVNGESARYKELQEPTGYIPPDWPEKWQRKLSEYHKEGVMLYKWALEDLEKTLGRKRAKESARFFLPMSNQITLDVAFNFRSFMHFVGLRAKDDAQREIAWVTEDMLRLVRETGDFPHSLKGFGY